MANQLVSAFESLLTDEAKAAITNSHDIEPVALGDGAVMMLCSYGPCGILYRRPTDFLWHPDPGDDQAYSDLSAAIVAAMTDSERRFAELDAARQERASATITVLEEEFGG